MQNRGTVTIWIALVWLTVLVAWAVATIDKHLNQSESYVSGGVGVTASPQGGFVVDQYVTAVPMGKNEVWIINENHGTVQVVTRDSHGSFHWSSPR